MVSAESGAADRDCKIATALRVHAGRLASTAGVVSGVRSGAAESIARPGFRAVAVFRCHDFCSFDSRQRISCRLPARVWVIQVPSDFSARADSCGYSNQEISAGLSSFWRVSYLIFGRNLLTWILYRVSTPP